MDENSTSHLSEVCRLCSSCEGHKLPIFGDEEERDPLSFKILVCVNVEVNNDDVLSTLICQKCLNHVNEWHQFKQLCDTAQAKQNEWLTRLLKSSSNVQDVDIKSEPPDELSEEDEIIEEEIIEEDVPVDILDEEEIKQEELDDYCHEDMPIAAASTSDPLSFSRQQSEQQMRELKSERQSIAIGIGQSLPEDEPENVHQGRTVPASSSGETVDPGEPPEDIRGPELDVKVKGGKVTKRENTFFCSECGKRFGTSSLLSRHALIHAGARFKCSACGLTVSSSSSLSRHMRIHTGLKPYSCAKCRKTFPGRSELCKHRRTCPGAKRERPVPILVGESRVPGANRRSGIVSRCTTCNLQFSRKGDLKKHVDLKHPASCRWCKRVFPNRISLREHLKTHMRTHKNMPKVGQVGKRIKRYFCKLCPVIMSQWSQIVKHRQLHLDDLIPSTVNGIADPSIPRKKKTQKPYVCQVCNETFTYWKDYMRHKLTHNGAGKHGGGTLGRLSMKVRKARRYQCETCDESFTQWYAFVRHRHQHSSNDLPSTSDSKVVKRQLISKSKPPTLLVKKTFNSIEGNPKCPICLKQFKTSAMARHMTSHSHSKNFSCPLCHRKMKYESSVDNHLRQVHHVAPGLYRRIKADPTPTGHPPRAPLPPTVKKEVNSSTRAAANVGPAVHKFTCHVCDKSFTSKDFLLTHHQIIHKGARGYKCKLCPQVFLKESLLDVHEGTHVKREGNRAAPLAVSEPSSLPEGSVFKCATCPKAFNNKKSLVAHQNRVGHVAHKPMEIKMKIFSCSLCHNSYNNENALHTHRQESHSVGVSPEPVGEYDCHVCRRSFSNNAHLKRHLQNVHLNDVASTPVKTEWPSTATSSGPLNCDLCGKRFKDSNSLKTHRGWHFRVTHTSPKLEMVTVKHNQDRGPRARQADSMNIDVTDQIHECHLCKRVFASSKACKLHLTKTHGLRSVKMEHFQQADGPGLTVVDTTPKVASTSNNSLESSQEFRCNVCQKAFQSSQSCRMHSIKAHSQLKQERTSLASKPARAAAANSYSGVVGSPAHESAEIMCGTCQKSFNTDKGRKVHMAIVHGVTSAYTSLKQERTSVTSEPDNTPIVDRTARRSVDPCVEEFSCFVCQKSFSSSKGCKIHTTIVHPSQSQEESDVAGDPNRRGKEASAARNTPSLKRQGLVCDLCDKPFLTPRAFNIHYAWHMRNPSSIDNVSEKVKKQLIESYVKDKIANTPPTLKRNQPISASPTLAQMQRSEKRSLPILTPIKQSGMPSSNSKMENALVCHICTLTFPSHSALQSHIGSHNVTSPGLRDCNYCHKSFSLRRNLVRHLRMCKMNLRKEKLPKAWYFVDCHFCRKTFSKRGNLLLHLKECMKQIDAAPELEVPRQGNAGDIDKSRECRSCFKVFSTRFNLLKHVKICRLAKRNSSVAHKNAAHKNVNKYIPTATDSSTLSKALPAAYKVDVPLDKTRRSKNSKAKRDTHIMYRCNMCPNEYKLYRSLLTHKIWHSRKSNIKLEPEATRSQAQAVAVSQASQHVGVPSTRNSHLLKGWTCDICSQLFHGKKALAIHRNTHNLRQKGFSAAVSRLSKIHTCKTCNKTFTNPGYLRNHIRQVHVKQIFSTKRNGKVKKGASKSKKKYIMFKTTSKQMAPVESVSEVLAADTPTVTGLEATPVTVTEIEVNH